MPPEPPSPAPPVQLGGGTLLLDRAILQAPDGEVKLTATEVDLLRYFLARPGVVVGRSDLLREVWGYRAGVVSRAVDHTVKRLRAKIERDRKHPVHLVTVTGRGYRFELPDRAEEPPTGPSDTGIPRLPADGVPRPTVASWLTQAATRPGGIQLAGPAGVGKSHALARWATAEQTRGRSVFWLRGRARSAASTLSVDTAAALEAVGRTPGDGDPPLVIWDDTDDLPSADLREAVSATRTRFPGVTLAWTQVAALGATAAQTFAVPPWTPDEAHALLALRAQPQLPPQTPGLGALLEAVDHRPRAIESLAPLLALFPPQTLLAQLSDGAIPQTLPAVRTTLDPRSPAEAVASAWRACTAAQRDLLVRCLALPPTFSAADVTPIAAPAAEGAPQATFATLLSLTPAHLLLPAASGRLRVDPFVRRWLQAHATPAQRDALRDARSRRMEVLTAPDQGASPASQRALQAEREAGVVWALAQGTPALAVGLLVRCGGAWRRRGDRARLAEVMETLHRDPPEDAASHARLLAFRARWLLSLGDRSAAQATAARAVARVRDQPDPELRSDVFREVGLLSFRLELPPELSDLATEAVDCVRDQPRSLRLASALSARGGIRINQGAYPAAEADLSEAIHRFEELGEAASAARCRGRIATLRKLAGRFSEAQALFDRARAAMPDDAPAYDQANLRMNHGNLLADLGQLDAATAAYQAAIEIGAAGGEDAMVASVQGSLATVLAEQRRDDEARAAFSEALRVHRLNGSRTQVAYCTLGLAELCMDTEDLATAGDLLDDIEGTIASLSSPQLTVAHGLTRSVWLSRMGQPAAALEAARRCGALMEAHRVRRQQTGLLFALGLAAASGGQIEDAQAQAASLRAELERLEIGPSSVLWRRLAELESRWETPAGLPGTPKP